MPKPGSRLGERSRMSRCVIRRLARCVATVLAVGSGRLDAQSTDIALREVLPATAVSPTAFGTILGIRQLPDGRVLVNDGERRQLVLLDQQLRIARVVLDSAADGRHGYGPRASPLIPYLADSTLFVDGASLSLLVLDPEGNLSRVMAAPNPVHLRYLAGGAAATDAGGNLIYRLPARVVSGTNAPGEPPQTTAVPDSASIVRARLDARTVDTIARVKVAFPSIGRYVQGPNGQSVLVTTINPLGSIDDWGVLSDGTIALVRGRDYHIDWIDSKGKQTSSSKMPFAFKRLTDADKQALIDSARADHVKRQAVAPSSTQGSSAGATPVGGAAFVSGGAASEVGVAGPIVRTAPGARIEFVPLADIPDYYPPIRAGAAKPDLDGRLWILPTTSAESQAGELVYDVISDRGRSVHRVRLPPGRSLAGFGRNGELFLMYRDASSEWRLERTTVSRNDR